MNSSTTKGNKRRTSTGVGNNAKKRKRRLIDSPQANGEGSPENPVNGEPCFTRGRFGVRDEDHDEGRVDRQASEVGVLTGLLPGDVDTLTELVNTSEKRIMTHVSRLFQKLLADVNANERAISDLSKSTHSMESNLANLKALILQNATTIARAGSSSRGSAKQPKTAGKTALQKERENKYPLIAVEMPAVFTPLLFCQAAGHSICFYMNSFHQAQNDHTMTAKTLSVALYGLQNNMVRNEFKRGVGKQHANFRFKLALCATRNALLLTDETFMEQEKQVIADLVREGKISPGGIEPSSRKPAWLTTRDLTKPAMLNARVFHEWVKSEHLPLPKEQRARLAVHVARFIIQKGSSMLRLSRERCKIKVFEAGMFLLVDWKKRPAFRPGHCQPVLRFLHTTVDPIPPEEVADCATSDEEHYELKNATIINGLIESRKELILEATYMVTVVLEKAPRGSEEPDVTELRQMRRNFNTLRMALAFMGAFTQSPEEIFLSSHASMARNIYRIALLLREFLIDDVEESCQPIRAMCVTEEGWAANGEETTISTNPSRPQQAGRNRNDTRSQIPSRNSGQTGRRAGSGTQRGEVTARIPPLELTHLLPGTREIESTLSKVFRISPKLYDKLVVKEPEESDDVQAGRCEENTLGQGDGRDYSNVCLDSDEEEMAGMMDL